MFNKKKNKYCCDSFSVRHQQPKTSASIRIYKFTSYNPEAVKIPYAPHESGRERFVKNSVIPYRFFLALSLEPSNEYDTLCGWVNLSYCPWCGVDLFTFYSKERNIEDYVNETRDNLF